MNLLLSTGSKVIDTELSLYTTTWPYLLEALNKAEIGTKDGKYFVRASGLARNNVGLSETAYVLILDGDSRIDLETGEIVNGAPSPENVHQVLASLRVNHCIYTSYSHNPENGINKYRVVIPCQYTKEQLPALLDYCFENLHKNNVMLFPVKENGTWSQPWYFPRMPQDRRHLFDFWQFNDGEYLNADLIHQDWLTNNPPKPEPAPKQVSQSLGVNPNTLSPVDIFNSHYSNPYAYLLTVGYIPIGTRLLRPNSDSGSPSVQLCNQCSDGRLRIYSHGGDALNDGYAHDAFDCFVLLEHGGKTDQAIKALGQTIMIEGIPLEQYNRKHYARA